MIRAIGQSLCSGRAIAVKTACDRAKTAVFHSDWMIAVFRSDWHSLFCPNSHSFNHAHAYRRALRSAGPRRPCPHQRGPLLGHEARPSQEGCSSIAVIPWPVRTRAISRTDVSPLLSPVRVVVHAIRTRRPNWELSADSPLRTVSVIRRYLASAIYFQPNLPKAM